MDRLRAPVLRNRVAQIIADALLAALAFYLAFELRFLDLPNGMPDRYRDMLVAAPLVGLGKATIFTLVAVHQKWWRYFNLGDSWSILRAAALGTAALLVFWALVQPFPDPLPRAVLVFDLMLTIGLLIAARAFVRFYFERQSRRQNAGRGKEVLVIGAGSGGQMVVRELHLNPDLGRPIGFVDDDPRKLGMRLLGLKVLGGTDGIGAILDKADPAEVVIAIPSAPGTLRAAVVSACRERQIPVRTLPTVFELLRGGVQLTRQLREVQVEDVLGRDPVVMELDRVGGYLTDRVVLVTGAGGSIGAELCRQIARVRPKLLVVLDHAEDNLFEIDRELNYEWHFSRVEAVLADCKSSERMLEVMQRFKPEVVFHAAAYKHVPLMEDNPLEAIRNNSLATRVVAETAAAAGAERFVLISTDKAVNPRTVMGASKALAEWIVKASCGRYPQTRFTAVRFGNVLGSSGSVVPIFRSQIERGGPVTVTDAEMTRYFMTIPEAVQLVIRAGDLGAGDGEVFVLEMGEPVRILDLARNMIRLAGFEPETDIAIEFTGPRPGEQLHEELLAAGEVATPTAAARIVHAVRSQDPDDADLERILAMISELVASGDETNLAERVRDLVSAGLEDRSAA